MTRCFRCEITHCSFINQQQASVSNPGTGYCVGLEYWSCGNLLENNIFANIGQFIQCDCGGTGNAMLYNYVTNMLQSTAVPTYDEKCGGHHNCLPIMNLWEGNMGYKMDADFTWGNSAYSTFLRNWFRGYMPHVQQVACALEIGQQSHHFNVI